MLCAIEAAERDPVVRALGALRWLCDVLPGAAGHAVWNFWTEAQDARFLAVMARRSAR